MQVARPRVVAQAAPQREHVVEVRPGERFHVREAREEALVVRNDRRDLGLLQHHLRQPDAIRIARLLPRQVMTPVPGLPAYEPAGESAHRLRRLLSRSCTRSFSPSSAGGLDPRRDLALRSNSARLTPFKLLSRSARLAPPESAFFIALTLAPPVCTSSATLPRPSRRLLLSASFSNGPNVTPPRSALSAKRLVLALALAAPERLP